MFEAPDIPGADEVIAWFGHWPTFHDAEVLSITLDRSGASRVVIHAFEMTPEVDVNGRYVLARNASVIFSLEGFPQNQQGIANTRIECFNHQNVLSSAAVKELTGGFELILEGCQGVDGSIVCERMSVTVEPGIPEHSIYRTHAGK
jgi:hypothetical protein